MPTIAKRVDKVEERVDDLDRIHQKTEQVVQELALSLRDGMAELRRSQAESDARFEQRIAESDARSRQWMEDLRRSQAESDARFQQRMKESDARSERGMEELRKSLAESAAQSEQGMAELRKSMAESDARFQQRMKESDARFRQGLEELRKSLAESAARSEQGMEELRKARAESDARFEQRMEKWSKKRAESDERIERMRKAMNLEWGKVTTQIGRLVEDIVAPSLRSIAAELFGPPEEEPGAAERVRRRHPAKRGEMMEIDAILDLGDRLLVTEARTTLKPAAVAEILEKLRRFREFFPEFKDRALIGVLGTLEPDPSIVTHAERQGLVVIGLGPDLMEARNSKGFTPKEF